jgi:GlcNAc-P-P-Und epimerase
MYFGEQELQTRRVTAKTFKVKKRTSTMKVLVTGGSGFIGTNLIEDLRKENINVLNFDVNPPLSPEHEAFWKQGDILNIATLKTLFQTYQPTHVVHLAARTDCEEKKSLNGYKQNTEGTKNVLEAITATQSILRAIITSTQFVCGPGYAPKHDEDYWPHTIYGQSKVIAEQLTRKARLDCSWTIIRPTTIWGPWHLRHRKQFFSIIKSGLYLHPGSKPCMRSWGYVGNVTYQVRKIMDAPVKEIDRKTYYVGDPPINLLEWVNGFSTKMLGRKVRIVPRSFVRSLGLIGDVAELLSVKFPITTSRYRSMTQDYITPMEPTLELVGDLPFSLESGIDETLRWLNKYAVER